MSKINKSILVVVGVIAVLVAIFGVRIAAYEPASGAPEEDRHGALGYPWRGAIHVHSDFSDGGGDVETIMAAAERIGLDFVVVSDHNPLGHQERPRPGWYGDVLLVVGEEISTDEGHLLALGVSPHGYRFGPTARQALADITAEGGWALVAHPDHPRQAWSGGWGGTVGLEVINQSSAWSRQSLLRHAATIGRAVFDADHAAVGMIGTDWPALSLWDALTELSPRPTSIRRPRIAIGAADAHGPIVGPLPRYVSTLGSLTTLVWIDEPADTDVRSPAEVIETKLLAALRAGRAAVETTALGDARAFEFGARSTAGRAGMGEQVAYERGPWTLEIGFQADAEAEIVVLRDGRRLAEAIGDQLEVGAGAPGTYRVEVYRVGGAAGEGVRWLVSNPIYIWPAATIAASRLFPVPPLPPPPPSRDLLVDAEFVANQRDVPLNTVETRDGDRSVTWSISLGAEADAGSFAAMAWHAEQPMDWSGHDGLVVELTALPAMRASLEIRTIAADGSERTWVYSLRGDPEPVPRVVPWDSFRPPWDEDEYTFAMSRGDHPSHADLERVSGVYLLVTPQILARGSNAMLRLLTLALYG